MIVTIDEAKKKWCPMVRTESRICGARGAAVNTYDEGYVQPGCMGPDCMMWIPISDFTGYCGLGGRFV